VQRFLRYALPMGTLMSADRSTARKKGLAAAGAATGSFLGVAGLVGTAYLSYDWFTFRAKRGMRF
jgi:hypothetical protein